MEREFINNGEALNNLSPLEPECTHGKRSSAAAAGHLPSDNQMGTNSHESRRWCGLIPRQPVCSDVGRQPGIEIGHALKIEQGFGQGLQPLQRQAANQAFLLRAQGPTAAD